MVQHYWHQPHLHLLLATIGHNGTPLMFWSLTLIFKLWWSTADMILSMCICSNTSKDVRARAREPSRWGMWQGWSNLEELLRKPIWREPDQQQDIIWHCVPVYMFALLHLFVWPAGRAAWNWSKNEKILLPKNIFFCQWKCPKNQNDLNLKELWLHKTSKSCCLVGHTCPQCKRYS